MRKQSNTAVFSALHEAIRYTQQRAVKAVNAELVNLYWQTGYFVSKQLESGMWGEKTVEQFAWFIERNDPEIKGFDHKNIYRMVQFYQKYASFSKTITRKRLPGKASKIKGEIVATLWRQLEKKPKNEIVATVWRQFQKTDIRQSILAEVNWSIHRVLIARTKSNEERLFYLKQSVEQNYSVRELERQISTGLYERFMIGKMSPAASKKKIPAEITSRIMDNYVFDFLKLKEDHNEDELQRALIQHMRNFILEIGKDFLFIGEEYKIHVGESEFSIDLLFYHRTLQCLVAFELKTDKFKPEHLGQLNFYLEALDRDVRKPNENPSIGILLCQYKDNQVVEYAMSRSLSPTLVSEYKTYLPDKKLLQLKLNEYYQKKKN